MAFYFTLHLPIDDATQGTSFLLKKIFKKKHSLPMCTRKKKKKKKKKRKKKKSQDQNQLATWQKEKSLWE